MKSNFWKDFPCLFGKTSLEVNVSATFLCEVADLVILRSFGAKSDL